MPHKVITGAQSVIRVYIKLVAIEDISVEGDGIFNTTIFIEVNS